MTFNLNTATQIQTGTTKIKMILWSKVFKGDKNYTFNQKQLLVSPDGSGVDLLLVLHFGKEKEAKVVFR